MVAKTIDLLRPSAEGRLLLLVDSMVFVGDHAMVSAVRRRRIFALYYFVEGRR